MFFLNRSSEKSAEKIRLKSEKEKLRLEEQFAESPAGQARAAKATGAKIFQIDIPLSQTKGYTTFFGGAVTKTTDKNCSNVIQAIEEEGWHLENVGYVFRVTRCDIQQYINGHEAATSGEIIGIYIFRAA